MSPSQNLTEVLNTLSDEVIDTALLKAKENGLDLNKAHIPLQESFQNLISIRSQLADAIEKNKLSQLPFSIQQKFANRLVTVQARLISFANGSDEVINISNDIEDTYVDLYNSRLTELSNEYLGYQARENQLKFLLTKADQLQGVLLEGAKTKEKVDELVNELENQKNRTNDLVKSVTENQQGSSDVLAKITETQQSAAQHLVDITGNEKLVRELLAEARSNESSIKTIEIDSKKFSGEIIDYKEIINSTTANAQRTVDENTESTRQLTSELTKLEAQIKEQLQRATGITLFETFQKRHENISKGKGKWLIFIGALIFLAISLTALLAYSNETSGIAFYLKISISLPLIFAISFCTVQYTRERKLEEEYAFKSNISLSLVPYKDLIEKLSTSDEQKEKYTAFLIETITKVFTSPTEKIFGNEKSSANPEQALKQLTVAMEGLMKPIEPVLKVLQKNK